MAEINALDAESARMAEIKARDVEPPWPKETGIWATYDLHCHCGAIRWTMKISPPIFEEQTEGKGRYKVVECNCSYCERNGFQCVHPKAENVVFTRGVEDRAEYMTGNKRCPQWFCKKCGSTIATDIRSLAKLFQDEPRLSINVRMLKDYDPKKLEIRKLELMKDMPPKYSID